jgi:hypothetical protein
MGMKLAMNCRHKSFHEVTDACGPVVMMKMTGQLGTPRGRYDEHCSKVFPSIRNQGMSNPGKSQTQEGDAC